MTHHALGNVENAREFLKKANDWAGRELEQRDSQNGLAWNRRATLKLLRQEADALLKQSKN